jgi:hypothetical protein
MGLTYQYRLNAPAEHSARQLEDFLKEVEVLAKQLGFAPTLVLNAKFDSPERRDFARRLAMSMPIDDQRLKGLVLPKPELVYDHDLVNGTCRLHPAEGVILVVTDERGCETCFGFLRYPEEIVDINGRLLARTGVGTNWTFQDFIKSPDPRYRQIIAKFREAGYLAEELDDYR